MSDFDPRRSSPAALRNRDAILRVLRGITPEQGHVLEVASGSGEHVVHFAAHLPHLTFQPTDPDPSARASIDAWVAASGLRNVRSALPLDVTRDAWPVDRADVVICCNMLHVAPWSAAVDLLSGARHHLAPTGILLIYGPFHRNGAPTSEGNAQFDRDLQARNASWGIRDLEAVSELGNQHGFAAPEIVQMPANNLSLIFRRTAPTT